MNNIIDRAGARGGWVKDFHFTASERGELKSALPTVYWDRSDVLIDRVESAIAMWKSTQDPVSKKERRTQLARMLQNVRAVRDDLASLTSDEHFGCEFPNLFWGDMAAVRRNQSPVAADAFALIGLDVQSSRVLFARDFLPQKIDAALWLLESALATAPARIDVKPGQSTEHLDFLVLRVVEAFEDICNKQATYSRGTPFLVFAQAIDKILKIGMGADTVKRVIEARTPKTTG